MPVQISDPQGDGHAELLASVAEQLKLPLLQIAQYAELASMNGGGSAHTDLIHGRAEAALLLLDSYLLGLSLAEKQMELELEPVSLSSLLHDVAHRLDETAKQYGVPLELHIGGKFEPVMAHAQGLQSALMSLGFACIEAHPTQGLERPLRLSVHRTRRGITAGVYGIADSVGQEALSMGRQLKGRARQMLPTFSAGNAAGVYVADVILQAMATELCVSRYHLQRGLAATFSPSKQLQLVL